MARKRPPRVEPYQSLRPWLRIGEGGVDAGGGSTGGWVAISEA